MTTSLEKHRYSICQERRRKKVKKRQEDTKRNKEENKESEKQDMSREWRRYLSSK